DRHSPRRAGARTDGAGPGRKRLRVGLRRPAMIGILLAAGSATRFGDRGNKLLQRLPDGRELALASAQNLRAALPWTVAVVRPGAEALAKLLRGAGARVLTCEEAEHGMGASLAAAIRLAGEAEEGFVIALADMPFIRPATISAVFAQIGEGATLAAPTYRGRR